jgi:hypothetical protein
VGVEFSSSADVGIESGVAGVGVESGTSVESGAAIGVGVESGTSAGVGIESGAAAGGVSLGKISPILLNADLADSTKSGRSIEPMFDEIIAIVVTVFSAIFLDFVIASSGIFSSSMAFLISVETMPMAANDDCTNFGMTTVAANPPVEANTNVFLPSSETDSTTPSARMMPFLCAISARRILPADSW